MIKAEEHTYQAIMDALLCGNFYSSIRQEIGEAYIEDEKLYVKTSPG